MIIFTIILSVLLVVFLILAVVFSIKDIKHNQKQIELPRVLRTYIRERRELFGVSNHGTSMDSVTEIQVISPKQMGLEG